MSFQERSIHKLFIANRGEICRRIAQSAKEIGILTASICRRGRVPAYLADLIDEFYFVDEESPSLYLDRQRMLEIAKSMGCNAIHPGFGFLSENAAFAEDVVRAGLIWVGPKPSAIAAMSSKASARDLARTVEVPCLDGLRDLTFDSPAAFMAQVRPFVQRCGFPVLIKAAMGGGGKGMRIVHREEDLWEQAQRAQSEAMNAFGDGSLIIEPYVQRPRHIEVQILADQLGQVVAIGDRDCSVQRRHQKIIEESPAPGLHAHVRKAMAEAAIRLAQQVHYDSVGTVEFLVDWSRPEEQPFYFLEMNTRLQVEHPVTEEAFGIDLVRWQLLVAQGVSLNAEVHALTQPHRHSIEVRLYAEDPHRDFFPSPGPLVGFAPFTGSGIRWERGVDSCDEVSASFDPMIAKVIATGTTRSEAMERLRLSLRNSVVAGMQTNQSFLLSILDEDDFGVGAVTTAYLKERRDHILQVESRRKETAQVSAESWLQRLQSGFLAGGGLNQTTAGSHISYLYQTSSNGTASAEDEKLPQIIQYRLESNDWAAGGMRVRSGFVRQTSGSPRVWLATVQFHDRAEHWVGIDGFTFHREIREQQMDVLSAAGHGQSQVTAPVPGKVVSVSVEAGTEVQSGDILLILESMKMEFEVRASRSGTVETVLVQAGDRVDAGSILVGLD